MRSRRNLDNWKWPGNEDVEELKSEEDWDDEKPGQSDSEEHGSVIL